VQAKLSYSLLKVGHFFETQRSLTVVMVCYL